MSMAALALPKDAGFLREVVTLHPGDCHATDRDIELLTVLGSCVAACIRDTQRGIGGMNHFMLPRGGSDSDPASASARYGVNAMEMLINKLLKLGASRSRLEAKVFGGGSVLCGVTAINVGRDNARFVATFLQAESIPLAACDLEGTRSRKVRFFPATGRVLVRAIENSSQREVAEREARYGERLGAKPVGGEPEFFR
jgi:chemotaxis protein CheD